MLDTVVYREEVGLTRWALIIIGLLITALTASALHEAVATREDPWVLPFLVILDLFFIGILLNFRKLVIEIDSTYLVAAFGFIKKRIRLDEVRACEAVDASFSLYLGMGIRYGWDGSLAFIPFLGDAVRLGLDRGGIFVFSTRNREQVLEVLGSYCV